jgi:predicted nucleic acid-binding protein
MRILIDTNVIIDYLVDRTPFADHAEQVLELCRSGEVDGFLTASAVTDIYYVVRKAAGNECHFIGNPKLANLLAM